MIPEELKNEYKKGLGIFIGAGISQGSGLPGWGKLLEDLINEGFDDGIIEESKKNELLELLNDPSKYLLVAEELRDIIQLDKKIKKIFSDDSILPSDTLRKIIGLKRKFIVTTNYDTLIESALVEQRIVPNDFTYKDAADVNDNLFNGKDFLLKAHGDARKAQVILTEKDYRNIIFKEAGYQSVLHVIFSMNTILFLGASLNDPELKLLLAYLHNIFHGGSPNHYAFMSQDNITKTEIDRWRKDFNIIIKTYDPKNNHEELEKLIDELGAIV